MLQNFNALAKIGEKYRVFLCSQISLILISLITLFRTSQCNASGEPFPIGARSWGMANAVTAVADKQSVFNNPAGLAFLDHHFISTAYHSRYNMAGLQTFALGGNFSAKWAKAGLDVERFGDKLYNEQKLGLSLAKSTGRVALGLKVSYLQAAIENFAVKQTFLTQFGVMAKLSSTVNMGFHAYNLTGARLFLSQRIPTVLRFGFSYQPGKQLLLVSEAEKDIVLPLVYKAGLEYQLVKNFYIRSGITSRINNVHFGFGFQSKQFIFDYAASNHSLLGFSHHLSLAYQLKSIKQNLSE